MVAPTASDSRPTTRRSGILEAGRHMFARKGYHGTGTAELAARAGCSEPTLYKYFPSKQAVFAAVLDDATECITERVTELMQDADDPLEVPLLAHRPAGRHRRADRRGRAAADAGGVAGRRRRDPRRARAQCRRRCEPAW